MKLEELRKKLGRQIRIVWAVKLLAFIVIAATLAAIGCNAEVTKPVVDQLDMEVEDWDVMSLQVFRKIVVEFRDGTEKTFYEVKEMSDRRVDEIELAWADEIYEISVGEPVINPFVHADIREPKRLNYNMEVVCGQSL